MERQPPSDPHQSPEPESDRDRLVIELERDPPQREAPDIRTSAQRFAIGFAVLVLVGGLLLWLPVTSQEDLDTSFVDALFTAISAASITGLAVVDTAAHWNFLGQLVILLLIQAGGLGFMVGASLLLVSLGRTLTVADSVMLRDGSPTLSIREATDLSKQILVFILACEAVGAVLLSTRFMADYPVHQAIWYGVFHAVSAFCNGGFDLMGGYESLNVYAGSIWVNGTMLLLIQAGALSYMVIHDAWKRRRWRAFALDTKLVLMTNALLIGVGIVFFLIAEWGNAMAHLDGVHRPLAAIFQSVSARTAGFSTVDFGEVHEPTNFLWMLFMLIGGAAGSTTGGVKLATAAIIFIAVLSTVRGQTEAQAFGRRIAPAIVFRALAIVALLMAVHFTVTLLLGLSEVVLAEGEYGFLALMFEGMSAVATVGISTGITPELSGFGKVILIVAMFVGRLGPLTAVYALQRRRQAARYRYPEEPVRMG